MRSEKKPACRNIIRNLAAVLFIIICSMTAEPALAEEVLLRSGSTSLGNPIRYSVYAENGAISRVRIEGTGEMPDFREKFGWYYVWGKETCPWRNDESAALFRNFEVGEGITSLGQYSFESYPNITSVTLPASLKKIPAGAFLRCSDFTVTILSRDAVVEENAFRECTGVKIVCLLNSPAHQYAKAHSMSFECTDCGHAETRWEIIKAATCTETGIRKQFCNICGQALTQETIPSHVWGAWVTVKKATVFEAKTREHTCTVCGKTVREKSGKPLTPVLKLKKSSFTMAPGNREKLKITKIARGDYVTSISSSSRLIAYCNYYTNVIYAGPKTGKAVLKIRLASGKTAKVRVTVTKTIKTTKISGVMKKLPLTVGEEYRLTPKRTPSNATQKITYISSNPDIAAVSEDGMVEGMAEGTCVITVRSGSISKTCRVTVTEE